MKIKCPHCDQPWEPECPFCDKPITDKRTLFVEDSFPGEESYWHKACWKADSEMEDY